MAAKIPRHKVFISFHEKDKRYRDQLVRMLGDDIVDKSVHDEDIDDTGLKTSTIRQKIRDDFIAPASVTIVLAGQDTYQRKHVDWEIGSSIRKTKKNSRCGLLSILLPNHPNYNDATYDSALIPPRLADNCEGEDPYAKVYRWEDLNKPGVKAKIRRWIDEAFKRKDGTPPNNGREPFGKNRSPGAKQESAFRGQIANLSASATAMPISTATPTTPTPTPPRRGSGGARARRSAKVTPAVVRWIDDGVEWVYDLRSKEVISLRVVDSDAEPHESFEVVEWQPGMIRGGIRKRLGDVVLHVSPNGDVEFLPAPPPRTSERSPRPYVPRLPRERLPRFG